MSETEIAIRLILKEDGEIVVRGLTALHLTLATALRPHKEEIRRVLQGLKRAQEQEESEKRGRNIVL